MDDSRFNVGDIVIVREWDDMVAENELDPDGDIYFEDESIYFIRKMRQFCGGTFEVSYADYSDDSDDICEIHLNGCESDDGCKYSFVPAMLIHAEDVSPEPGIEVDPDSFFGIAF